MLLLRLDYVNSLEQSFCFKLYSLLITEINISIPYLTLVNIGTLSSNDFAVLLLAIWLFFGLYYIYIFCLVLLICGSI